MHVDGFGTTRLAGQLRLDRPLGDDARRVLTASVEDAYRIFVGKVAAARDLTSERADSIARGRVWIGADARNADWWTASAVSMSQCRPRPAGPDWRRASYGRRYFEPELSFQQRLAAELGHASRSRAACRWACANRIRCPLRLLRRVDALLDREAEGADRAQRSAQPLLPLLLRDRLGFLRVIEELQLARGIREVRPAVQVEVDHDHAAGRYVVDPAPVKPVREIGQARDCGRRR